MEQRAGSSALLLTHLGFEDVHMADDGHEAMETLHRNKIALVISDWNMRPMNGLDLLRRVRAEPRFRETRFILISGEASAEHVIAAREAGANSFILKPFSADGLKTKIADAFRNASRRGRRRSASRRPRIGPCRPAIRADEFPFARTR